MSLTATRLIVLIAALIFSLTLQAQPSKKKKITKSKLVNLKGRVVDWNNEEPVANATVTDPVMHKSEKTDSHGDFYLKGISPNAKLIVYGENIIADTIKVGKGPVVLKVKLKAITGTTPQTINTGYQQYSQVRNAGAGFSVDKDQYQQRVFSEIPARLEGLIPGYLPVTNKTVGLNQPTYFSLGGRTTLLANPDPLIIVNDFPFQGNVSSINPDDIEDITVLRDATAVGIWGARAANGVLVLKTKAGRYIHRSRVSFNTFVSWGSKPDLFFTDRISAADKIFVDTTLFRVGFFDKQERNKMRPPLSPVVEAMYNKSWSNEQRDAYFNSLSKLDNRYDQKKYFYRRSFDQHYSLQFTGGSDLNNFYFSAGYDRMQPELRGSRKERKTTLMNLNMRSGGFEISPGASYTEYIDHNTDGIPEIPEPYEMLKNDKDSLVAVPYKHRYGYIDTVAKNKLLDWKYYPLQEFSLRNKTTTERDFRSYVALKYNQFGEFLNGLEAGLFAQYQVASSDLENIHDRESFYVRDLVNSYSQLSAADVYRPIPVGNIADLYTSRYATLNLRFKLVYTKKWNNYHLNVMAGKDVIKTRGDFSSRSVYNYTEDKPAGENNMDYSGTYPMFYFPGARAPIPNLNSSKAVFSNYFSAYLNARLRWKERYDFLVSVREDKSNLYASRINENSIPLFSAGINWQLSSERFYHSDRLPFIKLRATYGSSGNSPNSLAMQTISYYGNNTNGDPFAAYNNQSFYSLRWEKVRNFSLGMNLRSANDRLEVSVDWYRKKAKDLIGYRPLDPTTGNVSLTGNFSSLMSRNVDVVIETKNILRRFQWRTSLLMSALKDKVTHVEDTLLPAWVYCNPLNFFSVPDKPVYGIYSFNYKGLDKQGNPLGNNNNDYTAMLTEPGYKSLVYHGRATPAFFGSLTNDFSWKQLNLSFTILGKFGYYFRKQSINYYDLFTGNSKGSADFEQRWKTAGDENRTNVPAMPVTSSPDPNRDYFYNYSTVLVQRADHIRLQNIQLSYDLERNALKKLGLRVANFYINGSNIGILWRSNDWKIDPDRLSSAYPQTRIISVGFRGTFK